MSKHFLEMDIEELRADCLHLEKINAVMSAACELSVKAFDLVEQRVNAYNMTWSDCARSIGEARAAIKQAKPPNPKGDHDTRTI